MAVPVYNDALGNRQLRYDGADDVVRVEMWRIGHEDLRRQPQDAADPKFQMDMGRTIDIDPHCLEEFAYGISLMLRVVTWNNRRNSVSSVGARQNNAAEIEARKIVLATLVGLPDVELSACDWSTGPRFRHLPLKRAHLRAGTSWLVEQNSVWSHGGSRKVEWALEVGEGSFTGPMRIDARHR